MTGGRRPGIYSYWHNLGDRSQFWVVEWVGMKSVFDEMTEEDRDRSQRYDWSDWLLLLALPILAALYLTFG
jgi:hypothetical protein